MKKIAIIGSGDLGQLIAYHASNSFEIAGFFDDFKAINESVNGIKILGGIDSVSFAFQAGVFDELVVAIGYKHFAERKRVFNTFVSTIPMANFIHPSSFIDKSCVMGVGNVILPGCVLDRNVELKNNVLLNTGCVIAHDSVVGSHSFLSPAVNIAGFVSIGECCNIGINSTVIDNIKIADNTQTGGGTVVIKSIEEAGLYVGNPARFVK